MDRQIVVFLLAAQQYGIDIGRVYEIIRGEKAVRLPAMPSYLEGVIHLREQIIPVVDLVARLGLPSLGDDHPGDDAGRIVIVDAGGAMVGLRVDAVQEVRVLPAGSLQPPPAVYQQVSGLPADGAYVEGIALAGDQLIIMLDAGKIFNREEVALLAATATDEGVA